MKYARRIEPWLFLFPALLLLCLVYLYPLGTVVYRSLFRQNLFTGVVGYVGIENYLDTLTDEYFLSSLLRTLIWAGGSVAGQVGIGLVFALILHQKFFGNRLLRSLLLLPWMTSGVVIGLGWRWILNYEYGVMNALLGMIGIGAIPWLSQPGWAMFSVITANIWKAVPFTTIVFLAGLSSIPSELYEAASIDGANAFGRFVNITLPGLRYVTVVLMLLTTVWTITFFDLIFVMTQGGPAGSTTILPLLVYYRTFMDFQYGEGGAVAILLAFFNTIFFVLYLRALNRQQEQ